MANEITFTDWKKGDILTAERLNNIQSVVQKAGKALGIFNDDNNTSNSIEFSGASANIGSVSMDAHGLTVGNSKGTYTTTLYGTLQTDTISGITNSNVNIGNLIVGKYENDTYDGTAIFNIAKVEFKNNVEVGNNIIVGHPTVNAQTNSISQYNGEAIFNTAKTTLHGQTVIDSEVNTDLIDLLTVGHTSGSGANIQYYGKAIFNTSETEFHDIISNSNIRVDIENEDGSISSRNAYFGWQDTNVDNQEPYYGTAEFKTEENIFYNGLKAYNTLNFGIDELTGEPYDEGTAIFGGKTTTIYNLKVINDMTIGDSIKPVTVTMYNNLNVGHRIAAQDINTQEILNESYYGTATFNTNNSIFHGTTLIDNLILQNVNFPEYPTTEGNYILKLNVAANGTKTLTWVSEANN